jgi:N-acetylmuramoyl-L-alanine amidase
LTSIAAHAQVICIDPGHVSEVGEGTRGKKITELEYVWKVGVALRKELEAEGYKVVMTKKTLRQRVTNAERAGVANRAKADLMLRLHCDYAPGERGFATFIATKQGRDGKKTGPPKAVLAKVKILGPVFHQAVMDVLGSSYPDRGLRPETKTAIGAKYGALKGSIHSSIPSILVEMGVLNDRRDEDFLSSEAGFKKMVRALRNGVIKAVPKRGEKRVGKNVGN